MQSQRQLKVAELIKLALVDVLRKGKAVDARLVNNAVTITYIKVSPDLKLADCYFLPFGHNNLTEKEWLEAFGASKYGLRALVTSKVDLKYSPELRFHYDHGFNNATNIEQLIKAHCK
jgi:ribosome-binding factor A